MVFFTVVDLIFLKSLDKSQAKIRSSAAERKSSSLYVGKKATLRHCWSLPAIAPLVIRMQTTV